MSASATLQVAQGVKDRLEALAAARGVEPADLLADLVLEAETAQVEAEVNRELERLSQGPEQRRQEGAEMLELEATVLAWMRD